MRLKLALASATVLVFGTSMAAADPPSPPGPPDTPAGLAQPPGPRTPDGVPAGVMLPPEAADQAFEFGRCNSRRHSTGGWVCTEPAPDVTAARKPLARAAGYSRYRFDANERAYWGIGQVNYGTIYWEKTANFNGAQAQIAQAGTVWDGAHTVRYDFYVEKWRSTSAGWQYRETYRDILPPAPGCTRSRTRTPTYYSYHSSGYDFFMQYFFKLRDCVVHNPSTPDGTFYSPRYATKVYHCVDSLGSCYFKGY